MLILDRVLDHQQVNNGRVRVQLNILARDSAKWAALTKYRSD